MSEPTNETPRPKTWTRRWGGLFRWLHTYVSLLGFLALLFFAVTGFMLNHAEWFYRGEAAMRRMQGRIDPALLGRGTGDAPDFPTRFADPSPSDAPGAVPPIEESAAPPPLEEPAPLPPGEDPAAPPPAEEMAAPPPLEEMAAPPRGESAALAAPAGFGAPPRMGETDALGGPAPAVHGAGAVDRLAVAETLRGRHRLRGFVAGFAVDPYQCMVTFQGPGYFAQALIDRASGEYNLSEIRPGVLVVLQDLHRGKGAGPVWSWIIDASAAVMTVASITGLALLLFYRRRRFSGLLTAVLGSALVLVVYFFFIP